MAEGSGTVAKALGLLTLLGDHPDGLPAGKVAEASELPFSTAYRLLNTLVSSGYVVYEDVAKTYRLGLRIFQLGQKVAHARGFEGTAGPVLRRLTETTGESSILAVRDGDRTLTIAKCDGPQYRITTDPGDHGPLSTSAIGKVFLAFEPGLVATTELVVRTRRSITDRGALEAEMSAARNSGWVSQQEENDDGMAAVGVPVWSASGRLVAAMALASPLFRKDREALSGHLDQLRAAAAELGPQLPLS
ncbi:IclR family transcriptional regulator [Arthrobacter sp.]|uniref:IclR family transcriptional regulator n=1 Tax=Arthrobacter sp. TaxID=1667 RepID=UPI003A937C8E